MANLRTNNLCGEGGRNAIKGSVFFNGNYSFLSLGSGVISPFGTKDFTIEFWINQGVNTSNYTIIVNLHTNDAKGFEVAFHNGTIQVYTDTGAWRDTGYAPVSGVYEHIAFQRDYSGNTLKMYANGEEKWSVSNQANYDSTINYVNIGSYNIGAYGHFQGYLSNLRICTGHLVYSSNYFTPPTSELKVHYNSDGDETVLLCCQDSDDPTQEATGKTFTANGSTSFVNRTDNLIENGNFDTSATDGWTLSGGTAALSTSQSGTFGDGNHVLLTASSSFAYLKQAFTTVIGRTYRVNVQSNGGDQSFISTSTSDGDAIITDIRSTTQTANGRIAEKNFVATQTTYYMILRGNTGGANFDTASVYEEANPTPPKVLPPYGVDAGNTFNGAISMNSPSYMYFPTGRTEERGRGRGIFAGGYNNPGSTSYNAALSAVEIASDGVTSKFGDLTQARYTVATAGSSTRSVFIGGGANVSPNPFFSVNTMDFVTIATKGNAQDFGDSDEVGYFKTGVSSSTRGVFTEGRIYNPSAGTGSVDMEYITIATKGDGIQFGDLVGGGRVSLCNAAMSPIRGIFAGGVASPVSDPTSFVNTIEYVTMATLGNSVDFGDLKKTGGGGRGNGNCSSNTRGVFNVTTQSPADGPTLEYITIATTGTAEDFGDCATPTMKGACSNKTRGLFAGGFVSPSSSTYTNTCEKITIATTGNATDWGDTFEGVRRAYNSGISDSHGGLS